MSLTDWTIYRDGGTISSNPTAIASITTTNPLVGAGSLRVTESPGTDFQSINLVPATFPTGYLSGRMRTLIRLDNMISVSNPSHVSHAGLLCLQSVENMSKFGAFGGTGKSYGASVSIGNGFSSQKINLYKFTSGLDGSSGQLLAALTNITPSFTLTTGSVIALELQWRADPIVVTELGGVSLKIRIGQLLDFSDLQEVIAYVDTVSPYTATVSEGLWAGLKSVSGSEAVRFTVDSTLSYRTSIH